MNNWYRPLFSITVFVLLFCSATVNIKAAGQPQPSAEPVPAALQPQAPTDETTATSGSDKAGEISKKMGEGVEELEHKVSSRFGDWVDKTAFAGITWLKLIICMALIFVVLLFERVLRWLVNRKISASVLQADARFSWMQEFLTALSKPLSLFVWTFGIYAAASPLFVHFQSPDGGNLVQTVAGKVANIGVILALFWFFYGLVAIVDARLKNWALKTESTIDDMVVPLVGKTLRVFIVILGGIGIIRNLTGLELGPLLASLGIGGMAVAFAAKDSIANLFGTLTIIFDKPFQVGERIVVDNYDGVVEHVGFRSTRIRTLTGHLVAIPNEKLVNSSMENIGKRPHIRWKTDIGVTYDTPPDKVEKAVAGIKEILDNHEGMDPEFPPRVVFNGFNDWSLNIMVIAWYYPPDYWAFQAWIERTCLAIMRCFEREGIDFAFPSRTLYLANDAKRQVKLELLNRLEPL